MPLDPFEHASDSLIAPAKSAFQISPDDSSELMSATKAIFVGSGGDLTVRLIDNDVDVTFRNINSGTVLAIRARAIRFTGTTADDLVGLI